MQSKKEPKPYHTPKVVKLGTVKSIVQGSGGVHLDECSISCVATHHSKGQGLGQCPTFCPS